mmetsp:Transcript_26073/g.50629  ORF Transcript_26073/g.50629 Transcript_26073/m.50629 type:complete len:564 (+) Transcript_26073:266-1957(+)
MDLDVLDCELVVHRRRRRAVGHNHRVAVAKRHLGDLFGGQHRKLRLEREALVALTARRDAHASAIKHSRAKLDALRGARAALAECTLPPSKKRPLVSSSGVAEAAAEAKALAEAEALCAWADRWQLLRRSHADEWARWKLCEAAIGLAAPALRKHLANWRPLAEPSKGTAAVERWWRALCGTSTGKSADAESADAYGALVYAVVLPPLRYALTNEWRVHDPAAAVAMLTAWRPLLPDFVFDELTMLQVLPRLESALKDWNAKQLPSPSPPHEWLLPWRPLLPPSGFASLAPSLRHKLAETLLAWMPLDSAASAAARDLTKPWSDVLDAQSWRALLLRAVLPKLQTALDSLVINPAEQDLSPFHAVMHWSELLPTELLAKLLLERFFPKWLLTLQHWLSQQPDFGEVSRWYVGWKGEVGERAPALLSHDGVRDQLNVALDLLNTALGDEEPPPPPPLEEDEPPPPPDDDMEDADDSVLAGSRWAANDDDEDMSLRETLDRLAASHDLIFMSTADRHDGRQIFLFGKVRVLLDPAKHLVYAKLDKRGFAPTSLAQLVKEAQARSG